MNTSTATQQSTEAVETILLSTMHYYSKLGTKLHHKFNKSTITTKLCRLLHTSTDHRYKMIYITNLMAAPKKH